MDDFVSFMEDLYRQDRGVDPTRRMLSVEWKWKHHSREVHKEIEETAKAQRSDPFAARRVRCHHENGIADLGDYGKNRRP
jgi:hypothetical protein